MAHKKSCKEWDELFKSADKDGSGELDIKELAALLRTGSNSKMSDAQIAKSFVFFDGPSGDKRISKEEFIAGLEHIFKFQAQVTALFKETDKDGSGFLDKEEMRSLLKRCGASNFSEQDLSDMIKDADSSGDGKISLTEFLDACC